MFEGTSFEGIPHVRPSSHEPVPGEEESLLQAATATDSGMSGSGTARLNLLHTLMMSVHMIRCLTADFVMLQVKQGTGMLILKYCPAQTYLVTGQK